MLRRAWSRTVAGAVLGVVLAAPAFAMKQKPVRADAWAWLGNLWSRAVEEISLIIDPDGSATQGEPTVPGPSGDINLIIDPNG
jgi:hypothetical protein